MIRRTVSAGLILTLLSMAGCSASQGSLFNPLGGRIAQGVLTPPPAGDSATAGWSLGIGGDTIYKQMDMSEVHDTARALQGKMVDAVVEPRGVGSLDPTVTVHSIKMSRLQGTVRRTPIDARHPTGWMFATALSGIALELPLDPSAVMRAAEQLDGKRAVLTGSLQGVSRTGVRFVADTLQPQ